MTESDTTLACKTPDTATMPWSPPPHKSRTQSRPPVTTHRAIPVTWPSPACDTRNAGRLQRAIARPPLGPARGISTIRLASCRLLAGPCRTPQLPAVGCLRSWLRRGSPTRQRVARGGGVDNGHFSYWGRTPTRPGHGRFSDARKCPTAAVAGPEPRYRTVQHSPPLSPPCTDAVSRCWCWRISDLTSVQCAV
jgi:hypothetical protein